MRMRQTGHIAVDGEDEKCITYKIVVCKPEGKSPCGTHGVGGRIILKCILKKQGHHYRRATEVLP
jgi:hypothetical protein